MLILINKLNYAQSFNTYWKTFDTGNSLIISDSITDIEIDTYDTKWVGTKKGYISINGNNWKSFNSFAINQIQIDSKKTVWLAGNGGVIYGSGDVWTPLDLSKSGINDKNIKSISFDKNGNLWLATTKSIAVLNGSNWNIYNSSNTSLLSDSINFILTDDYNNKWIATSNGAIKFDGTNWSKIDVTIPDIPVENGKTSLIINKIYKDKNNQIYFITNQGIVLYNSFNSTLYKGKSNSMKTDKNGIQWIGLYKDENGCGLNNILSSENNFNQTHGCQDGMSGKYQIALYNGCIDLDFDQSGNKWIATNQGLVKNYNNSNTNLNAEIKISRSKCIVDSSLVCIQSKLLHPTFINTNYYHSLSNRISHKLANNDCVKIGDNEISNFSSLILFEGDEAGRFNFPLALKVIFPNPPAVYYPNICMVSNIENHNTIIWENVAETFITKYRVYKQNKKTSEYDLVNEQSKSELSQWIDTTSNNQVERYLLAYVDSCGNEHKGQNHTTILLSSNLGVNKTVNLSWNAYEGVDYDTYEIWRSTDGINFTLLGNVANNTTTFIDYNPPTTAYYQIRISILNGCSSTKRGFTYLNSNTIDKDGKSYTTSNLNEIAESSLIIYPNPTKNLITISNLNTNSLISITDLNCRKIYESKVIGDKVEIPLKDIAENGIYFIHLYENGIILNSNKIILE